MTKVALAGTVVFFGTGLWLVVAPFAVGYQPRTHHWTATTLSDLVVGAVLIITAATAFFTAIAETVDDLYRRAADQAD